MDEFTLSDALKLAITTEQIGAKLYTRFAQKLSSEKEIADIYTRLAKEELGHESQFKKLLEKQPKGAQPDDRFGVDEYLKATAISEFFRKDTFSDIEKINTSKDALIAATGLEKATLLFYQALRDSIGPDPSLNELIKAEKEHLTVLMKAAVSDAEFRGLKDKW